MPRYHFNVYNGVSTHDRDGTDFADVREARRHALRLAETLLDEEETRGQLGDDWRIEVTDEAGVLLFRLVYSRLKSGEIANIGLRSVLLMVTPYIDHQW